MTSEGASWAATSRGWMPTVAESSTNQAHELHSVSIAFTRTTVSDAKREESVSEIPASRILLMTPCLISLTTSPPTRLTVQLMNEFSSKIFQHSKLFDGAYAFLFGHLRFSRWLSCGVVPFKRLLLSLDNVPGSVSL